MLLWKSEKQVVRSLAAKKNAPYRKCGRRFFDGLLGTGVFTQSRALLGGMGIRSLFCPATPLESRQYGKADSNERWQGWLRHQSNIVDARSLSKAVQEIRDQTHFCDVGQDAIPIPGRNLPASLA
jgi:hypothetical protein